MKNTRLPSSFRPCHSRRQVQLQRKMLCRDTRRVYDTGILTDVKQDSLSFFRQFYRVLSGKPEPFPWQEELFCRLHESNIPTDVVLPTGCGKTSVMIIWLIALAYQARNGPNSVLLPRRLVWVVNRRVVVDQATEEAEGLKQKLRSDATGDVGPMLQALRRICTRNDDPIGVSTLRGQFADNAEWRNDPARASIIVGTVDMIGSRLLFSGYGRGFKSRPLHAGFIGQDALLVHDEAHLEPAFQHLIVSVQSAQKARGEYRPFHVMALTATSPEPSSQPFSLTAADRSHAEIRSRIEARKGITFHSVESDKQVPAEILRRATEFRDSNAAILIFLRKLEDVQVVSSGLRKHCNAVRELTGTMRGLERDQMAKRDSVFARFAVDSPVSPTTGTVYLICTSAGEVGVNMSSDHLVCDLATLDSMIQRFGRVNRFGKGHAVIEIVHPRKLATEQDLDARRERTLALLRKLPLRSDDRYDASPVAFEMLPADEQQASFTPKPVIVHASDILFDAWALTSVREKLPGRPPVADWLHGISDWEPPQTYIAWREEVNVIGSEELRNRYAPEDLLDDYPLKPHELIRDASRRVCVHLSKIAEHNPNVAAWKIDSNGGISTGLLTELVPGDSQDLGDCIILLPPQAGGLTENGMFDSGSEFEQSRQYDVADEWIDELGRQRRCRVWDQEPSDKKLRQVRSIDLLDGEDGDESSRNRYWRWYVRPRSADDEGSVAAIQEQEWHIHVAAPPSRSRATWSQSWA